MRKATQRLCRREGILNEEADDFESWAMVKLIQDDYSRIQKFEGRSSFESYISVVLANLLRDYRNHRFGKWRPSTRAKQLGTLAVELDRMVHRDQIGELEAVETLLERGVDHTREELEQLLAKLPRRTRPKLVSSDTVEQLADLADETPAVHFSSELREDSHRTGAALTRAISDLPAEDAFALHQHYLEGTPLVELARMFGIKPRQMYWRVERSLKVLRTNLENAGVDGERALDLLAWPDFDLRLEFPDQEASP